MSAPKRTSTRPGKTDVSAELLASVVVPVRDGGLALKEALDALQSQTLAPTQFEVLVADDGSSDGATDGLETTDGRVRVLSGPPRNSYAARNRAVAVARAKTIAFCDADCVPEPGWLEAGLEKLEAADVVAGSVRFLIPAQPAIWTLLDMDFNLNQEHMVRRGVAATANLFVRRTVFEHVGGFDESLPNGSDNEFVSRAVKNGARLTLAPAAVVWHPTRDTGGAFLRKVWKTKRATGVRRGRRGQGPGIKSIRFWCPPYAMIWRRRSDDFPLLLNRCRLAGYGMSVTTGDQARAIPIMYLVIPFVIWAATVVGWADGRWFCRQQSVPLQPQINAR